MKKYIIISFIILFGCGSSAPRPDVTLKTPKMPSWMLENPVKEGYAYASASEIENKLSLALEEAEFLGRTNIAEQMTIEISGFSQRVQESVDDVSAVNQYNSVQKEVFANVLNDCVVVEKEIAREKYTRNGQEVNGFRAYVLVEYDFGAAQKRLLDEIKSDEDLYKAMRTTELMEEMEQKVEEYRQRQGR